MARAHVGLMVGLMLTCGCVRLGYDSRNPSDHHPDASHEDAGEVHADGGVDVNMTIGHTGLKVADILGFYSGTWGDMLLRKVDNEIWGAYVYKGGTLTGSITQDGVFQGWWSQTPSRDASDNDAGEVEFRWLTTDGGAVIHLDGRWRWGTDDSWQDNWDIDLVTDRSPPQPLTDHFNTPADFKHHP